MTESDPRFNDAEFLLGVASLKQLPEDDGTEAAFVGRSNSGKSSTINAIAGRRALARTSKQPGRTQQINFFRLGDQCHLVDLPGYGYAKVNAATRRGWDALIDGYLRKRQALTGLVLVMDARRPLTVFDRQILDWCAQSDVPVRGLLNKADKLGRGAASQALLQARRELASHPVECELQLFSALHGQGVEEVRDLLARWLQLDAETSG